MSVTTNKQHNISLDLAFHIFQFFYFYCSDKNIVAWFTHGLVRCRKLMLYFSPFSFFHLPHFIEFPMSPLSFCTNFCFSRKMKTTWTGKWIQRQIITVIDVSNVVVSLTFLKSESYNHNWQFIIFLKNFNFILIFRCLNVVDLTG